MITWDDVVELLAFAAVFDQRRAGELDIRAWHQVATNQRWTAAAAQRVICEHYERGADRPRITPAAITDRLRDIRNRAAQTFRPPHTPDELPAAAYPDWYRARLADHVDTALQQWGTTGTLPGPATIEAPTHTLHQLLAAAPDEHRDELAANVRRLTDRTPGR